MPQTLEIQVSQHPEEEETLSFCDLPVTSSSGNKEDGVEFSAGNESDLDFEFGSIIGSVPALDTTMCAADELFSGGQLLPFRHSISSEIGSDPRSESVIRVTELGPSRSSSSRSSSTRSQQSATSTISSSSSSSMGLPKPKPKPANHFHSHPSPNPQIRASGSRGAVNHKSTMWQVLRLGLVRTPEIELQDLRARSYTNKNIPRNSSISSSSSTDDCNKIRELLAKTPKKRSEKKNKNGIFGSCKCSIGAIEPILMLNENKRRQQKRDAGDRIPQVKRVGSNHRTFEWLVRDLSQTSVGLNA